MKSHEASPLDDALRFFAESAREVVASKYEVPAAEIAFEAPRRPEFGDFSTNVAFSLAKLAQRSPQDVATDLIAGIAERNQQLESSFSAIEAVGGFINLRLSPSVLQGAVAQILRHGERFGEAPPNGQRISLEFGSANPTGPLLVVQGRSMSIGATLANVMRLRGYDVFVEWIINDAGGQLDALGRSVYARYRELLGEEFCFRPTAIPANILFRSPVGSSSVTAIDGSMRLRIGGCRTSRSLDVTSSSRSNSRRRDASASNTTVGRVKPSLHASGKVREGVDRLRALGLTYEQDGALFFRAMQFGDDKDRVLLRSDGRPTYFCMDVAYHYDKLRNSDRVVDILGPDHHGYIDRLKGMASALGYPGRLDVSIVQQVTLMRGREQVSMSKRAGEILQLDEIVDEVGLDAARFFFIMPAMESPLTFDLKLAVEKNNENPVYYVQYGHARIASVLRRALPEDVAGSSHGRR